MSSAEVLFITNLIAGFTFINMAWTLIQFGSWIKKKFRPPEEAEHFTGKDSLVMEQMYEMLHEIKEQLADMHKWHEKEDENGVKLIYSPRAWGRKMEDTNNAVKELRNYIELLSKSGSRDD
jgi:hypothetical protein